MPHRRDQIECLDIRASVWRLVIEILKDGHRLRLPGRRFGPDAEMFLVYGAVIVSYSRGKLARASDIERYLEIPRQTARRHLDHLVDFGLVEREGHTFRPSQKVGPILGLKETTRAVRQAATALGII
jgi:predicted DNA-binding transcriptional regulator